MTALMQVWGVTKFYGPRDTLAMSEPERWMRMRTDWALVHQTPRDGLRMGMSAGGNVGERLMAVGARHYGDIRTQAVAWLGRVEIAADRSGAGRSAARLYAVAGEFGVAGVKGALPPSRDARPPRDIWGQKKGREMIEVEGLGKRFVLHNQGGAVNAWR